MSYQTRTGGKPVRIFYSVEYLILDVYVTLEYYVLFHLNRSEDAFQISNVEKKPIWNINTCRLKVKLLTWKTVLNFFVSLSSFFFFYKKNNLQVGVSGWRGGGGADSKEYGFICICIPGCLQMHFVALVILRGLKKRFNCTYFFVEL